MAKDHYIIAPLDGRWIIRSSQGSGRQTYDNRTEAIRVAIQAAPTSGQQGNASQVLALDENHQLYPVRTYGVDAFMDQSHND